MAASVVLPARRISAITARVVALALVACSDLAALARAAVSEAAIPRLTVRISALHHATLMPANSSLRSCGLARWAAAITSCILRCAVGSDRGGFLQSALPGHGHEGDNFARTCGVGVRSRKWRYQRLKAAQRCMPQVALL